MKNRALTVTSWFGILISLFASVSVAEAAGLPLVISVTVDYTHNTLTINGQNFGSSPAVTLNALAFSTQSSASSQIVANFPSGKAPASFTPGTYFLTVTFKNQLPTIFGVDIGANGAPGPAGAAGPPGVQGATGPAGPAGAARSAGAVRSGGSDGCNWRCWRNGCARVARCRGASGIARRDGSAGTDGCGRRNEFFWLHQGDRFDRGVPGSMDLHVGATTLRR